MYIMKILTKDNGIITIEKDFISDCLRELGLIIPYQISRKNIDTIIITKVK